MRRRTSGRGSAARLAWLQLRVVLVWLVSPDDDSSTATAEDSFPLLLGKKHAATTL